MKIPPWADETVSKMLPEIRACGEGQNTEFKVDFPQQAHTLAEVVAAFATSGGGKIFIGVDDDSNVVGLDDTQTDKLFHRAQGIVAQVQPRVEAKITLAYDGGFVLVIDVAANQPEPVYYYDQRPFVRDGRTSRRATPDEVKSRVWSHPSSAHRRELEAIERERAKRDEDLRYQRAVKHQEEMDQIREDGRRQRDALYRMFTPPS
jgi:predicted HTH transcriptional regulator